MSRCLECCRREATLIHEQNNLRKYARFLARRKYGPSPTQLAELEKIKTNVAMAVKFKDEHEAECSCPVT